MTLSAIHLILSMAAARIEMSDHSNKLYIGSILRDPSGDFHIYDYVPLRGVFGYFRNTNTVRLGDLNTTLQVGTKLVATQEWTNAQGVAGSTKQKMRNRQRRVSWVLVFID